MKFHNNIDYTVKSNIDIYFTIKIKKKLIKRDLTKE